MEHLIHLKGYKASHDEGGILKLGTKDSFGIETLKIDADEAWDGLIISATFVTSAGRTKMTMKPDNTIVVPPEATAADTRTTINRIVFSGIKTQVQRITTDLPYEVDPHAPIDGDNSTPRTPDEYIQFVEQMKEEVRKANPVPDPGTGNDGKVPTVRGNQYVLETPQGGGSDFDINTAAPTFTEAEARANIETGETIPTLFGKIKKFFTDLKTVAFTGKYSDLTGQPQALKNPNALTFTGGATGTYDGSSPVSIAIPQGGGGSGSYSLLKNITTDEEVDRIDIPDINCKEALILVGLKATSSGTSPAFLVNGGWGTGDPYIMAKDLPTDYFAKFAINVLAQDQHSYQFVMNAETTTPIGMKWYKISKTNAVSTYSIAKTGDGKFAAGCSVVIFGR